LATASLAERSEGIRPSGRAVRWQLWNTCTVNSTRCRRGVNLRGAQKIGKKPRTRQPVPAATGGTRIPAAPSPAQRLLPCFLQVGKIGPHDPFSRAAGNTQPRLEDRLADTLYRRSHVEAPSKCLHTARCHLRDEARGRLREEQDSIGLARGRLTQRNI